MCSFTLLNKYGVFIVIVSETLGTVTGDDGKKLKVDESFITTSPYLLDALYVVGGRHKKQERFNANVNKFINGAYKLYKPIGVASMGQPLMSASKGNNLAGVVFATNNPNFGEEFILAIAQQRFWNRT